VTSPFARDDAVRRRAVVSGRVQAVWFRDSARREAERLGVSGSARNRADGTLELEVEGRPVAVAAFLAWAAEGPPRARVDRIEVEEVEPTGRSGFALG
jgi:acylphosphatase